MWFLPGQEPMLPSWKSSEGIVAVLRNAESHSSPADQASVSLAASAGLLQNHLLRGEGKPRWQLNICKESGMFVFAAYTCVPAFSTCSRRAGQRLGSN